MVGLVARSLGVENLALHIGTKSTNQHGANAALSPLCER
jgi:hypothetical protein